MKDNRNIINDEELTGVSGGAYCEGQSYLTQKEVDSITRQLVRLMGQPGYNFMNAYGYVNALLIDKINNNRYNDGAPKVTEEYFRKRCKEIWVENGGSLK